MLGHAWQSWARFFSQEWVSEGEGGVEATATEPAPTPSRRRVWLAALAGLLLAALAGWGLLVLNSEAVRRSHPAVAVLLDSPVKTVSALGGREPIGAIPAQCARPRHCVAR